jgi:hypothetical protein
VGVKLLSNLRASHMTKLEKSHNMRHQSSMDGIFRWTAAEEMRKDDKRSNVSGRTNLTGNLGFESATHQTE